MLKRLGFVDGVKGWSWVKNLESYLEDEKWNKKVNNSGRKCVWFGVGVNLGFNQEIFQGLEIDKGLRTRGNEFWKGDDWNSVLVYKYQKGVELKPHTDRDIFDSKVVLIDISNNNLFGGTTEFIYNNKIEILSNGEVIEFDSKITHGLKKVESERWSISFRKVLI